MAYKKIKNTSEYLRCLEEIATLIDTNAPTEEGMHRLNVLQEAVKDFELSAVQEYNVSEVLVKEIFKNSWKFN
jgi:antitoxin component HigA of HigAB toxin-antitoxin module